MSMTTVAQPTSNAEWHARLAMAILHPFGSGALASRNPSAKHYPARRCRGLTQKSPIFSLFQAIPAYSSINIILFCGTPSQRPIAFSGQRQDAPIWACAIQNCLRETMTICTISP